MASDKILSIISLLEEIKNKTEYCVKYNEQTQALIDKISQVLRENSPVSDNCDDDNLNKSNSEYLGYKANEEFNYLESILCEKMKENAKLKAVNERLLRYSQEKAHKIKEFSRSVSLQNQQNMKISAEKSSLRDIVGKYNVEIQKLKKQLCAETRKLHAEKANGARLETSSTFSISEKRKVPEIVKKSQSVKKEMKRSLAAKRSYEDLDKKLAEKILTMKEEPNIKDETFDSPESLDSDADEEVSNNTLKESSDKLFSESINAEFEVSSENV